jgi:hypothetical protein
MKKRFPRGPRIANDNGNAGRVVSLSERRESGSRRRSLENGWAPAILATFFVDARGSTPRPQSPAASSQQGPKAKQKRPDPSSS